MHDEEEVAVLYEDDAGLHWMDRRSEQSYWLRSGEGKGKFMEDCLMILNSESEYWHVERLCAPADSQIMGPNKTVCAKVFDTGRVEVYTDRLEECPCAQRYLEVDLLMEDYAREQAQNRREAASEGLMPM